MIKEFQGEYRFLSNFYPCVIMYDGICYPSTEHAYQAHKVLAIPARILISNMLTPGQAKRAGARSLLRKDWESVKLTVMEDILRLKFSQEPFKSALIATGFQELIEDNNWGDTFWGVCKGIGQNNLGKLLMKIRSELSS